MELFSTLGFEWNRDLVPQDIPRASLERVVFRFHRMLPEYVWNAGVLKGNPFTFPEVKTLIEGVTVGGRRVCDHEQILSLTESAKYLVDLVKSRQFSLGEATFCSLQKRVIRNGKLEWDPPLRKIFDDGIRVLQRDVPNPCERAIALFLFGALRRFFVEGCKRTSCYMMNGVLMSEGIDAISIPATRARAFGLLMEDFHATRNATDMMTFVTDCHPEIVDIRRLNPQVPLIPGLPDSCTRHSLNDSRGQGL